MSHAPKYENHMYNLLLFRKLKNSQKEVFLFKKKKSFFLI